MDISSYAYGLPGPFIWGLHLVIGCFLLYVAFVTYNKRQLPNFVPILLFILGSVVVLYHLHLWWYHRYYKKTTPSREVSNRR